MPHPKDRKPRTRARILQAAATLFAAQGFAGTSIDAVMRAAGLTRGGFYAHFDSKAALYREALAGPPTPAADAARGDALDALLAEVFEAFGPWAFLATDAASRLPAVRQAYAHGFTQLVQRLQPAAGDPGLAGAALLVGTLSAALTLDDPAQRQRLLQACRTALRSLVDCPAAVALLDGAPTVPPAASMDSAPELLWAVDEAMAEAARRWRQALH